MCYFHAQPLEDEANMSTYFTRLTICLKVQIINSRYGVKALLMAEFITLIVFVQQEFSLIEKKNLLKIVLDIINYF